MKKSAYITFRTTDEIKKYLEEKALKNERTISWIINKILEEYFKKMKSGS